MTPPPVDSPKAESRVPQSVRNAVSSRLSLTTLCDWPPYALAIIAVAKPPTVPAIWPPSSVSASPPPLNNDASKSELTVEAVDAAVSGSIPCSEAPPTTDDMRPSAPLCESSDKVSGFALSVETVERTWDVAAADVPVPTWLAAAMVAANRLSIRACSAASCSGVFSITVPFTSVASSPPITDATFEIRDREASPSPVSAVADSRSPAKADKSSVDISRASTRAGA